MHLKGFSEAKNQLRPQVVLAFYSVVIMRTNSVTMRHSTIASIATKSDQIDNPIYNSKLAIDWLSKIYRSLEEGDNTKNIITGLFLKVKGFNNYKMVVRDLDPRYISTQTLGIHFEGFKNQCPNLF